MATAATRAICSCSGARHESSQQPLEVVKLSSRVTTQRFSPTRFTPMLKEVAAGVRRGTRTSTGCSKTTSSTGLTTRQRRSPGRGAPNWSSRVGRELSTVDVVGELPLPEAVVKSFVPRVLVKIGCCHRARAGFLVREAGPAVCQAEPRPSCPRRRVDAGSALGPHVRRGRRSAGRVSAMRQDGGGVELLGSRGHLLP